MLLTGKPYAENLEWRPEDPARFHVVEKSTGRVAFVREAEPFFSFHHVNAFERDGGIFADLLAYPDPSIIGNLYLDVLRDSTRDVSGAIVGELRRYRLDPSKDGPADYEVLCGERMELPRTNYARAAGRPYSNVYGMGLSEGGGWTDRLVKADVEEGTSTIWQEKDCYPGEPVFVPSPGAEAEDDG